MPRLLRWDRVLKVVSRGSKVVIDPDAGWRVDGERIVHEERLATADDFPTLMMIDDDDDDDVGGPPSWGGGGSEDAAHVGGARCCPDEMSSADFRGPGGNMCVGRAYTICDATPLLPPPPSSSSSSSSSPPSSSSSSMRHEGPFREMRAELGVQENGMRFRVKLDYAPSEGGGGGGSEGAAGVRRGERQEEIARALFGPPGAPGGLYDPPPVGSEERAVSNYMLLDFEGGATLLLPHRLDQHSEVRGGGGRGRWRGRGEGGGWGGPPLPARVGDEPRLDAREDPLSGGQEGPRWYEAQGAAHARA